MGLFGIKELNKPTDIKKVTDQSLERCEELLKLCNSDLAFSNPTSYINLCDALSNQLCLVADMATAALNLSDSRFLYFIKLFDHVI